MKINQKIILIGCLCVLWTLSIGTSPSTAVINSHPKDDIFPTDCATFIRDGELLGYYVNSSDKNQGSSGEFWNDQYVALNFLQINPLTQNGQIFLHVRVDQYQNSTNMNTPPSFAEFPLTDWQNGGAGDIIFNSTYAQLAQVFQVLFWSDQNYTSLSNENILSLENFKDSLNFLNEEKDFMKIFGYPILHSYDIRGFLNDSPILAYLTDYRTSHPTDAGDDHMILIIGLKYQEDKFWAITMDPDAEDQNGTGRFCMIEWSYLSNHWYQGYTFNNYEKMIKKVPHYG
jgi:hypothetical protein